jgi:hypothetical protein
MAFSNTWLSTCRMRHHRGDAKRRTPAGASTAAPVAERTDAEVRQNLLGMGAVQRGRWR